MAVPLETAQRVLRDRYAISTLLGDGGMAAVFRGRRRADDLDVAVKVLRPEFAAAWGDRFQQEIAILGILDHPNILPLLESDRVDDLVYYTMPYATGASLRKRLDAERRLSMEDTLAVVRDTATALDYAHARDVVHRDIKPGNILFSEDGRAMICDFGVARAVWRAGGDRISPTGVVVGTPSYMSPEQASGEELDHRSDIYSLACLVYEMLAGEPPFTGRSAQIIMARQVRERPPSLRVVRPDIPERVERALHTGLSKEPEHRPQSAAAFVAAMEP